MLLKGKLLIQNNYKKKIFIAFVLLTLFILVFSTKKKQSDELEYLELIVIGDIVGTYKEDSPFISSHGSIRFLNVYRKNGKYTIDINPLYVELKMDNNYKDAEELMQTKEEAVNLMQLRLDDFINNGYQSFFNSLPEEVKQKTINCMLDFAKEHPDSGKTIDFILNGGNPTLSNGVKVDTIENIVSGSVREVFSEDKTISERYQDLYELSESFFTEEFYPTELYSKEKK